MSYFLVTLTTNTGKAIMPITVVTSQETVQEVVESVLNCGEIHATIDGYESITKQRFDRLMLEAKT